MAIGERKRVEEPEPARHGVRGKPVRESGAQVADRDRDLGIGHHVRDEPRAAADIGNGGDHGLPHPGDLDQGALDDGGMHALAADLDPIVGAAEHLEEAVVVEAADVAGVDAAPAVARREGCVAPVAERDAGTGDDDPAELARGGVEAVVVDRDLLGGRGAHRYEAARELRARFDHAEGDDAGLVRAVHREQPRVGNTRCRSTTSEGGSTRRRARGRASRASVRARRRRVQPRAWG